jgi:uncharacterized protein YdaU (DUF1376 family)
MAAIFSGPWLPWFHGDFMKSTQGWTLIERAVYILLLGASWEMGPLPTDKRRLAGIVGAQLDEFEEAWAAVRHKFEPTDAGYVNQRLEIHRAKQADRSEKARQSAESRWGKGEKNANASANAHANGNASAMLEPMLEGMRSGCSSELRTHILETQSTEPKPSRAKARPGTATPPAFHQKVIEAYHELCPALPQVKVWTDVRRRALDARIAERKAAGKPADTVDYWRGVFTLVAASDFLCGRASSFRADLPWLLKPENFAKTIEGRYGEVHSKTEARAHG